MRKLSRGNVYFLKNASSFLFESGFVCVIRPPGGRIAEFKVIAEITPILFHDPLRLWFATVIVRPGIVKSAIETDMHVASAEGTDIPPSHG